MFLHLFAKGEKASLTPAETEAYRLLARELAGLEESDVLRLAAERGWKRIES